METFTTKSTPDEALEIKFNMLLLLRNLYTEGLQAATVKEEYRKYFGKEINEKVFDPVASNPLTLKINRQFMKDDITVYQKYQKFFFTAKKCCTRKEMQFLVNAISFYKTYNNATADNLVTVRSETSENCYYNENVEKYDFSVPRDRSVAVEDSGQSDPLADAVSENDQNNDAIIEDSPSSVEVIEIEDDDSTTTELTSSEVLESYDIPATNYVDPPPDEYFVSSVDSTVLTKSYWMPHQNSRAYPAAADQGESEHYNIAMPYPGNSNAYSSPVTLDPTIVSATTVGTEQGLQPRKHLRKEAHNVQFYCTYDGCGRIFSSRLALLLHETKCHSVKPQILLKCPASNCAKEFHNKEIFEVHKKNCRFMHRCPITNCKVAYGSAKALREHMRTKHNQSNSNQSSTNEMKCSVPNCLMTFKQIKFLKIHENRCRFKYEVLKSMVEEET